MRKEMAGTDRRRTEGGASVLELIVVLVIVGIVSAFTVSSIRKSRDSLALQNSVRKLAAYIEKARLDAVRRLADVAAQPPWRGVVAGKGHP